MRTKKAIPVVVLCVMALILGTSLASALPLATTASVHNKDNSAGTGLDITECSVGTHIWVFWTQSPANTEVEIQAFDPDGNTIVDVSHLTASQSGSIDFSITAVGVYYVQVVGAYNKVLHSASIASATIFVLPESIFGTLAAIGAGFAAFGTVKVYRKRQKN